VHYVALLWHSAIVQSIPHSSCFLLFQLLTVMVSATKVTAGMPGLSSGAHPPSADSALIRIPQSNWACFSAAGPVILGYAYKHCCLKKECRPIFNLCYLCCLKKECRRGIRLCYLCLPAVASSSTSNTRTPKGTSCSSVLLPRCAPPGLRCLGRMGFASP